jgi:hypothetical protein
MLRGIKINHIIFVFILTLALVIFPRRVAAVLTGDINNDGRVDIVDVGMLIDVYGILPVANQNADLNHDSRIDIVDVGIMIDNYGSGVAPTPTPTPGGGSGAIWTADADSNGNEAWHRIQCAPGGAAIVDDPQGRYGKVYQAHLNTGDTYSGDGTARCEYYGTVISGNELRYSEGDDYYLGWRTLVSNGIHTDSGNSGNFIQLKGDSSCSGPAIGLTMENGNLTLRSEQYGTFWIGPAMTSFTGTWHDIVLHVHFSTNTSTGFVEAWLDGVRQSFIDGSQKHFMGTMCSGDSEIYLKMGYYRGPHPEEPPGTHWFETPRLGNSYESVVPR